MVDLCQYIPVTLPWISRTTPPPQPPGISKLLLVPGGSRLRDSTAFHFMTDRPSGQEASHSKGYAATDQDMAKEKKNRSNVKVAYTP